MSFQSRFFSGVLGLAATTFFLCVTCLSPSGVVAAAYAQTAPHKTPDAARRFQGYLDALAKQNQWAIVAEGAPVTLNENFTNSEKYHHATPEQQLRQVADAADYAVEHKEGSAVWLLTKRYSSPRDFPCVTVGECAQALQKIAAMTAPLLPPMPEGGDIEGPLVQRLYRALPAEQRQQQGTKPIPVSLANLSAATQRDGQLLAASLYINTFNRDIQATAKHLKNASQARLKKVAKMPSPTAPKAIVWFGPNDKPEAGLPLGGIGWLEAVEPGVTLSPTASTTLGKEVARINAMNTVNARGHVAKQSGLPCKVDAALVDKPLTVAGLENTDAAVVFKAFAQVYDLHLSSTATAQMLGFQPARKEPVTLLTLRDAVIDTLPAPYKRIMIGDASNRGATNASTEAFSSSVQRREVMNYLSREAIKQLRLAQEAKIDAAGDKGVPVTQLTPTEQPALVAALMPAAFSSMVNLISTNVPNIVTHRNDLYLTVVEEIDEKQKPSLTAVLFYKDEQGNLRAGGRIGNVPAPSAP